LSPLALSLLIRPLDAVTDIDFIEMPIGDAALNITANHRVPVLFADGVDFNAIVTAKYKRVPLRTALDGMLPPLGLEYEVKNGWIVIKQRSR
jgi:hypothetical protein